MTSAVIYCVVPADSASKIHVGLKIRQFSAYLVRHVQRRLEVLYNFGLERLASDIKCRATIIRSNTVRGV